MAAICIAGLKPQRNPKGSGTSSPSLACHRLQDGTTGAVSAANTDWFTFMVISLSIFNTGLRSSHQPGDIFGMATQTTIFHLIELESNNTNKQGWIKDIPMMYNIYIYIHKYTHVYHQQAFRSSTERVQPESINKTSEGGIILDQLINSRGLSPATSLKRCWMEPRSQFMDGQP